MTTVFPVIISLKIFFYVKDIFLCGGVRVSANIISLIMRTMKKEVAEKHKSKQLIQLLLTLSKMLILK